MKRPNVLVSIGGALAMLASSAHSQTACAASPGVVRLSNAQMTALFTGQTVCGIPGPGYPGSPNDRFQEEHLATGDLFDYKRGPGHPVDPREKVGSWSVGPDKAVGAAAVTHKYTGGTAFTWAVFGPATNAAGAVYSFCSGNAEHVRAFVIPTGSGCAAFPSGPNANAKLVPKVSTPRTPATATAK